MFGVLPSGQAGIVYRRRGTSSRGLVASLLDPSQLLVPLIDHGTKRFKREMPVDLLVEEKLGSPASYREKNVPFESWAPRNSAWTLSRVANGPNSPKYEISVS
jgi:hypothetical protein